MTKSVRTVSLNGPCPRSTVGPGTVGCTGTPKTTFPRVMSETPSVPVLSGPTPPPPKTSGRNVFRNPTSRRREGGGPVLEEIGPLRRSGFSHTLSCVPFLETSCPFSPLPSILSFTTGSRFPHRSFDGLYCSFVSLSGPHLTTHPEAPSVHR